MKKNKLIFSILFMCLILVIINLAIIKNNTVSKKDSNQVINKILEEKLSTKVNVLSTKQLKDNLYVFHKNDNSQYGISTFKKNNILNNRFNFHNNINSTKQFNALNIDDNLLIFGDFSKTTASSMKIVYKDMVKSFKINTNIPLLDILDIKVNNLKEVKFKIFDDYNNEISKAL